MVAIFCWGVTLDEGVLRTLEEIDGMQSAIYFFWFATLFARNDGALAGHAVRSQ